MLSNYSNFSHVPYKNEFHNVQGNASKYFHLAQKNKVLPETDEHVVSKSILECSSYFCFEQI